MHTETFLQGGFLVGQLFVAVFITGGKSCNFLKPNEAVLEYFVKPILNGNYGTKINGF